MRWVTPVSCSNPPARLPRCLPAWHRSQKDSSANIGVCWKQFWSTALTVFNDVITRQAFLAGVPLIDLRLICTEDADYANPIEPSSQGGDKIARSIARTVTEHDFTRRRTEVFLA